jgi:ribonuclease HI
MQLRHIVLKIFKGAIGKGILIISDSRAAIKVLDNCKINAKLVWDCHQTLMILAECNNVQLLWVLGHEGNESNEIADQLAKRGLLHPFIGPELNCGTSNRDAEWVIRNWLCREHQEFSYSRTKACKELT